MSKLTVFITHEQINEKVNELADKIRQEYRYKNPLLVGALKGSFIFMSDLVRALDMPLEVDFVSVASYGAGKDSYGKIELRQDLKTPAENRDILLVEDIVDTGLTLNFLLEKMRMRNPISLKVCCLLDKPSRREVPVHIDYHGFVVPDNFIVGYGLDFDEKYRYLPDICYLEE
ncbi:MAG: hypoxanthine phosphoribosyltransferase [Dehalococcoidia bacterium]